MMKSVKTTKNQWDRIIEFSIDGVPLKKITRDSDSPTGRMGICADIFLNDKYVVKIGFNRGEGILFISPEDELHFAKTILVDIEKQWIIQERINCVPHPKTTNEQWETVKGLKEKYRITDVGSQPHNWTPDVNGTPVIYDYDYFVGGVPVIYDYFG